MRGAKTGGRGIGAINTSALVGAKVRAKAKRDMALLKSGDFQGDALEFLRTVYKDPVNTVEMRMDAAKWSLRFERPALSTSTMTIEDPLARLTEDQLVRLLGMLEGVPDEVSDEGDGFALV